MLHPGRIGVVAVLAGVLAFGGGTPVLAQSTPAAKAPSPADIRAGKDLYKTGHERVKASQWEAAREAFARAYELYPEPVILANLAGAEVRTGRVVAGLEHYRQVIKRPAGMEAAEVEAVSAAIRDAEAKLAHVKIGIADRRPVDRLELDGVALSKAALDVDYPVDPGKHVIVASREGHEPGKAEVELKEGESKPVRLVLHARALAATPPPITVPEEKPKTVFSSPWFWVVTGVVVVGAAGLTVCLAAVCRDEEPRGFSGSLGRVNLP